MIFILVYSSGDVLLCHDHLAGKSMATPVSMHCIISYLICEHFFVVDQIISMHLAMHSSAPHAFQTALIFLQKFYET